MREPSVDLNLTDRDGCTSLWNASCNGHLDVIKWLLSSGRHLGLETRGIDVFGDKKEYSAVEIARKEKRTKIVDLLERFKEDPVKVRKALREELEIEGARNTELF